MLREVYERRAELQYAEPVALPDARVDRKFERITALALATLPASSWLDAGCGDGRFMAAVAASPEPPTRLVGCDISERILATAGRAVALAGSSAELVRANLERLPFEDDEFDRVVSIQVVEHLLDPAAGIRELARVLRPGGVLVLSTDNTHVSFRREQIASLVELAGLAVDHVETFKFHLDGFDRPLVKRTLNLLDRAISPHPFGDIVAVVAHKP